MVVFFDYHFFFFFIYWVIRCREPITAWYGVLQSSTTASLVVVTPEPFEKQRGKCLVRG